MINRISITTILCIAFSFNTIAQVKRVAIVDFEIQSTNTKHNGLGKAMADMLITDMKNNVSNSKAVFIERNQINKILQEQNFQKGANVDKKSTITFGKILGINYLLTGSIFVLDGMCNIDSKLIDVATGEIVSAESVDGNLSGWLTLKSELGKQLAAKLALPITKYKVEESATISENVLTNYSLAVDACDNNNFDEAQKLLKEIKTEDANFEYSSPLMKHIIELINATKKFDDKEVNYVKIFENYLDSLVNIGITKWVDYKLGLISFSNRSDSISFVHAYGMSVSYYPNFVKLAIDKRLAMGKSIDPKSRFSAEFESVAQQIYIRKLRLGLADWADKEEYNKLYQLVFDKRKKMKEEGLIKPQIYK
jgi:TolB-like protein